MTSLQSTAPRHRHPVPPLRIALVGRRGEPGVRPGDELTVVEVGRRLLRSGHDVAVDEHAVGTQTARHLASTARRLMTRRFDVAVLFDPDDIALAPLIRSRGTAVVVRIDGSHHRTLPTTRRGRAVEYRVARESDAVVVDAPGAQDRFADEYGLQTDLIGYGARIVQHVPTDLLEEHGLVPQCFHLIVVGGDAAEAHLDEVVEGYHRSRAHLPLVLASVSSGSTPAIARARAVAARDPRIRTLHGVEDRLLDQLHAHAASSLHGAPVGATDPGLLRSMGAGTAIVAWDAVANREVAGVAGSYFGSPAEAARRLEEVERYPFRFRDIGELMQERARTRFSWDVVHEQYQALAARLARGYSTRGVAARLRGAGPLQVPVDLQVGRD